MTEQLDPNPATGGTDDINDGIGTYEVVVLVEHEISSADAAQIQGLHSEIADQVVYHVLIPAQDAAARLESTMGTLAAGDMFAAPLVLDDDELDAVRAEFRQEAERQLGESLSVLGSGQYRAVGRVVEGPAIDALAAATRADDAREAIVLTSPHVVQEFFHVDWASQARRKLGVPVLHLIEHELH
ncbi:hypothetical protein [Nocardioides yefusunii]|uniref:Uncharacterized protein n=1 Tax=Nocardioides yefusunii TaxID=2500546 RepID=A0ABW1QV33_9ACTN|nr:hypothetical protein [Nocardioides yefusunii]